MTVKAKVARLFVANPKKWISTSEVRALGGETATRKLRQLRSEGWSIKARQLGTDYQYQLTRVPAKAKVALYV